MSQLWQLECVEMVRVLINDLSDTPVYTDDRLVRVIVIAGLQVTQETGFDTTYTVDISQASITPDPSADATKDNTFINLLCLRAAVTLLDSEVRYYAINSFRITDGPSSIDVTGRTNAIKTAAQLMTDKYNQIKMLYLLGQSGCAVLSPFTVQNIYPITRFQ